MNGRKAVDKESIAQIVIIRDLCVVSDNPVRAEQRRFSKLRLCRSRRRRDKSSALQPWLETEYDNQGKGQLTTANAFFLARLMSR